MKLRVLLFTQIFMKSVQLLIELARTSKSKQNKTGVRISSASECWTCDQKAPDLIPGRSNRIKTDVSCVSFLCWFWLQYLFNPCGWLGIKHQVTYLLTIVQELCESRGGRPGLSVLTSLLVSVDVKLYWTMLRHWSQLVPNMSADIWGH